MGSMGGAGGFQAGAASQFGAGSMGGPATGGFTYGMA